MGRGGTQLLFQFHVTVDFVFSTTWVEIVLVKGTVLYIIKCRCQYCKFLLDTSFWKTDQESLDIGGQEAMSLS